MSTTYTTNYHLGKQTDTSDNFDMSVITDNMDIIDSVLSGKQDALSTVQLATEQGGIAFADGTSTIATNRVRTISPIPIAEIFKDGAISAGNDMSIIPRIYKLDGTYITGGDEAETVTYDYLIDKNHYANWNNLTQEQRKIITEGKDLVRFVVKKSNNEDITPNDVDLLYTYKTSPVTVVHAIEDFASVVDGSIICKSGTYYISSSIAIDTAEIKRFNGNGTTFVVTSDIPAFVVQGSLDVSSASPTTLPSKVYREMGTVIEQVTITSTSGTIGTGFDITKTMGLTIKSCTIRNLKNGMKISGINRNITLESNFVYACNDRGILFDSTCNLHQCNINDNHISYCHTCIDIYNSSQIANFQIIGNDIEISNYPDSGKSTAKCINVSANSSTVYLAEISISGNTLQGHSDSESIICVNGYSSKTIDNVSITGNHISNTLDVIYEISNVKSMSITGNNYKDVSGYIIQLDGNISYMSVVSETGFNITSGLIHALTSAVIDGLVSVGCCFNVMTNSIETSSATNVRLLDT